MKKVYWILIFTMFLSSCAHEKCQYDKEEWREYELLSLDPPKHFYIYLQDVKTKKIYSHVYVSKHCNNYRNLTIGKVYTLKRVYWTIEGKEYADFENLYETLCQ